MSGPTIIFPSRGVMDKRFRYVNAASTDIRQTFRRVKKQQAMAARRAAQQRERAQDNVLPLFAEAGR